MVREIRILGLAVSSLLLPVVVLAQAPPQTKTPVAPKSEQLDPDACAHSDIQTTVGKGGNGTEQEDGKGNLSDKLARSGGVICPPVHVGPEIKQPTPPGGDMPVIPPPGGPGGDKSVRPK